MGQSNRSNSEELDQIQQPDETPAEQPPEQPPGQDSGEEQFYDLDITDINRDDLTPEMQSVYDKMLEQHANMNTRFTQGMQGFSATERDAQAWRSIVQHPELSRYVYDAIYKIENNIPLAQSQAQEAAPKPDPQEDPEAYFRSIVKAVLSEELEPLRGQMGQVTGFVRGNQARLEYDNLCAAYPAAKAIGMQAIQRVQQQYTGPSGQPISMEEALTLMSRDNQAYLEPPASAAPKPRRPAVEKPSQPRGGQEEIPLPPGARGLQRRARDLAKEGQISLAEAARRALQRLRNVNPEE